MVRRISLKIGVLILGGILFIIGNAFGTQRANPRFYEEQVESKGNDAIGDKIVIIDPGHNSRGNETQIPGIESESQSTLATAHSLAQRLGELCHVQCTRKGDNRLSPLQRSATANQSRGDLLISLLSHTRPNPERDRPQVTVYYHQYPSTLKSSASEIPSPDQASGWIPWFHIQTHHLGESHRLAEIVVDHLTMTLPQWAVHIQPAPLAVLAGADMPAILLEIFPPPTGNNNPTSGQAPWPHQIAQSVQKALGIFWEFEANRRIIQDLHE